MTRLAIVLSLVTILIGLALVEQHFIQRTYSRLESDTVALHARIISQDKIDTDENIAKVEDMYYRWLKSERRLSMLARHADMAQVSDALIYTKNFIRHDIKEEATAGLLRLEYLIKTHSFNIGTSIQNVI